VIKNLLSETGLIFVGYGGNDKSIIDILKEVPEGEGCFQWGIYWIGETIPDNEMGDFLKSRNAVWVNHRDFDELMLLIKEEFGFKPPSNERFEKLFKTYFDTFQSLNDKINEKPESGEKKVLEKAVKKTSKEFKSWWSVESEARKYKDKDPDKAEKIYKHGILQFPDSPELIGNYAVFLHFIRKDYDKTEELYRKALEIEPKYDISLENYAVFLHFIRKDYDKAEEMYRKALEIDPMNAINVGNYALFMHHIRKDYGKAEELYRKALEIEPERANILGNYTGFLLTKLNEENGFKILKKAILLTNEQDLLLECWFYCYAHTKDEKSRNQSLGKIKDLIKSGVRSPGWNLEENVKTAIKSGHPVPEFLKKLSRVISDEIDAKELDSFDVWLQGS
jgi:protein O-mannosyl-transferase